jgi:hypothetical protein
MVARLHEGVGALREDIDCRMASDPRDQARDEYEGYRLAANRAALVAHLHEGPGQVPPVESLAEPAVIKSKDVLAEPA